jgi:hypothetical protein
MTVAVWDTSPGSGRRDASTGFWYRLSMKFLVGFLVGLFLGVYLAATFPDDLHAALAPLENLSGR